MNIYEFIKLYHADKGAAVWEGEFLAARLSNEHRHALYHLSEFFVEVEMAKEKEIDLDKAV